MPINKIFEIGCWQHYGEEIFECEVGAGRSVAKVMVGSIRTVEPWPVPESVWLYKGIRVRRVIGAGSASERQLGFRTVKVIGAGVMQGNYFGSGGAGEITIRIGAR
jgi:hypothetical protein